MEVLTCGQAERAVSLHLDGELSCGEGGRLTLHLSSCEECGTFACGQRALRAAIRALAAVPLPASLQTFSAGSARSGGCEGYAAPRAG
jgi:hypothetical protein